MPWLKEANRGRSLGMLETGAQRLRGVARFGVNVWMINRLVNNFRIRTPPKTIHVQVNDAFPRYIRTNTSLYDIYVIAVRRRRHRQERQSAFTEET